MKRIRKMLKNKLFVRILIIEKLYHFLLFCLILTVGIRPAISQDFWKQTNMPPHLSIYSLGADGAGNVYAGGYGQGLFKSSDNGTTWDSAGMNGYWINSISINETGDIFLIGIGDAYGTGIFKSMDNADSWTKVFGFDDNYGGFNCVYVAPDNSIWTGLNYSPSHNGIYKSTDNGVTWDSVFSDQKNFNAIVATTDGKVFAGSYGRIYYSLDNGNTWGYSEEGLYPSKITAMAANSDGEIYAATAGYGIYRSDNNGTSWEKVAGTGSDYSCLLIDNEQHIYAGSQGYWVNRSNDNGNSWELLKSGLTNKYILSLTVDKDGYLYAGSDTSGVFRSVNKIVSGIWTQENNSPDISVYPNPSTGHVFISYRLSSPADASLTIFNNLGKSCKIFVKEKQSAGKHHFNINTLTLPAGIYFCKLQTGKSIQLKKLIVR